MEILSSALLIHTAEMEGDLGVVRLLLPKITHRYSTTYMGVLVLLGHRQH